MENIEKAFILLKHAFKEDFGLDDAVLKIKVTPKTFDELVIAYHCKKKGFASFRPSDINNFRICGVKIEADNK